MPDAPSLPIGALARRTRCPVPTIRYYEEIGLLPPPVRAASGHRYYREQDVARLTFIKHCRDFSFSIDQVRPLLALFEDGARNCSEARDLAQQHLQDVQARIEALRQLESSLAAFVHGCNSVCVGGPSRDCVILEGMASAPARSPGCCSSRATHSAGAG